MRTCLTLFACTTFVGGLRVATQRRRASHASLSASASAAPQPQVIERLLEECAKEERSLSVITTALAELEQAELPKRAKRALLGNWKLAFASALRLWQESDQGLTEALPQRSGQTCASRHAGDQEMASMFLTGQSNMLLAVEGARRVGT